MANLVNWAHKKLYDTSLTFGDKPAYKALIERIIFDPLFQEGYGSEVETTHAHHAYPGGLMVHTAEVLDNAFMLVLAQGHDKADIDICIMAAIWHDWGKVYDYDINGKKTEHGKKVYHVVTSWRDWEDANFELQGGPIDIMDAVSHCILSHHGRKEWGSPVEPQTIEARIVHMADYLSMEYGPGRKGPDVE